MSNVHFKFEELKIYDKALAFGEKINSQIQNFPKEEMYRLSSQFIRAADSIALNIAEGSAASPANFNRYLQMAWDSGHECVVCSTKAFLRGFISEEINEENRQAIAELNKMITSYKNFLKKKITNKPQN
ncbi:four helix bundle protein [Aequorivita echinoideorum]|nr:four helix bundle protein [Aequorivita echinoideorum]